MRLGASHAVALVSLLAACSNASSSSSGRAECGTLVAPPPMSYPSNGATAVADGKFNLVLGRQAGTSVQLVAPDGTMTTLSPTPGATNASYSVGPLQPATTYTVQIFFAASGPCAAQTEKVGSFTTT